MTNSITAFILGTVTNLKSDLISIEFITKKPIMQSTCCPLKQKCLQKVPEVTNVNIL